MKDVAVGTNANVPAIEKEKDTTGRTVETKRTTAKIALVGIKADVAAIEKEMRKAVKERRDKKKARKTQDQK